MINVSRFPWGAVLWLGVLSATAPRAWAQAREAIYQFPLQAMDLAVQSSPEWGVQVMASPNIWSSQGDSARVVWLNFHPDTVRSWLDHAAVVLRSALFDAPDERVQWTRRLRGVTNQGALLLGRGIKGGKLRNKYWMTLGDSSNAWYVELERKEADSLLQLLVTASGESVLTRKDSTYTEAQVDRPVEILSQAMEVSPNTRPGRAFAQYVVGVDGKAEPESIRFRLLSHSDLERPARKAIVAAVFKPAVLDGQPVRQMVQQVITVNPPGRSPP